VALRMIVDLPAMMPDSQACAALPPIHPAFGCGAAETRRVSASDTSRDRDYPSAARLGSTSASVHGSPHLSLSLEVDAQELGPGRVDKADGLTLDLDNVGAFWRWSRTAGTHRARSNGPDRRGASEQKDGAECPHCRRSCDRQVHCPIRCTSSFLVPSAPNSRLLRESPEQRPRSASRLPRSSRAERS
jgi:hypothetical protein